MNFTIVIRHTVIYDIELLSMGSLLNQNHQHCHFCTALASQLGIGFGSNVLQFFSLQETALKDNAIFLFFWKVFSWQDRIPLDKDKNYGCFKISNEIIACDI